MSRIRGGAVLWMVWAASVWTGCAAAPPPQVAMAPMPVQEAQPQPPQPLNENHFRTDRTSNLSEAHLHEILEAPVFLESETRVGIVPVATAYEVDNDLPLSLAPQRLSEALEETGLFDVTTEVSTDWPAHGSVAGLRELAARYRVKYLLLYRHRFVQDDYTNAWGWAWVTGVGGLVAPSTTLRASGVMEASLFDVRTGTILFTVFERVDGADRVNIWHQDLKHATLKYALLDEGITALAGQMVHKVRRLEAARLAWEEEQAASRKAKAQRAGGGAVYGSGAAVHDVQAQP
ncbi:MAG: hypothetical protein AAFX99_22650 [Myxococcota bacterium]